jgi:hypothetical protein
MPGNSTAPVPLLSVLEYLDQEEDAEPPTSNPTEPLDAPEEPEPVKQPAETKAPPTKPPDKEETKDNADLPKHPATPVRTPHLFFTLKSPTPVLQTLLPPQLPETPPVCPHHAPARCDPLPTPDPAPEAPWRSACTNKGVALAPNSGMQQITCMAMCMAHVLSLIASRLFVCHRVRRQLSPLCLPPLRLTLL